MSGRVLIDMFRAIVCCNCLRTTSSREETKRCMTASTAGRSDRGSVYEVTSTGSPASHAGLANPGLCLTVPVIRKAPTAYQNLRFVGQSARLTFYSHYLKLDTGEASSFVRRSDNIFSCTLYSANAKDRPFGIPNAL